MNKYKTKDQVSIYLFTVLFVVVVGRASCVIILAAGWLGLRCEQKTLDYIILLFFQKSAEHLRTQGQESRCLSIPISPSPFALSF